MSADGHDGSPGDRQQPAGEGARRRRRRRRRRGGEAADARGPSDPAARADTVGDDLDEVDAGWDSGPVAAEPAARPAAEPAARPAAADARPRAGDAAPGPGADSSGEAEPRKRRRRRRRGREATGSAEPGAPREGASDDDARDGAGRDGRDPARRDARRDDSRRDAERGEASREAGRPGRREGRDTRRDGNREASRDGAREASRDGRRDPARRDAARGSEVRPAGGRDAARRERDGRRDDSRRDPGRRDDARREPRAPDPAAMDRGWAGPASPTDLDDDALPAAADSGEAWGDDSAAPTADVSLAADLPPDPAADDLDPVSASLDDEEEERDAAGPIRNVVGVKFTTAGKIYLFDAGDDSYPVGDEVVVETERGPRLGRIAVAPLRQGVSRSGPLRRVLRRPSRGDQRRLDANQERAEGALRIAKASARDLGLPIKVFRVEMSLGGGKALIYYSSDEKVDARRLLRDLAQKLHLRIELRQTGVRDEAKMVGGIGSCGQELCCTTWLPAFVPVSIKNAKDQGLVLNPTKVSGQCGRLKCCLVYEQATYAELRRGLPKLGKRVVTASGEGRVVEVDVLRQRVRVSLVGGEVEIFEAGDVRPMFPSQPGGRPGDQPA